MDGWKERQTRQIGRQGERKRDDCGCNRGKFKVLSHELLGVAVIRDHLSIIKPAVHCIFRFRRFPEMMEKDFFSGIAP